jgi:hypothetical protein
VTELDLDALEQEMAMAPVGADIGGVIGWQSLAALIQRLREAETERDQWTARAFENVYRIAQLERVREAAETYRLANFANAKRTSGKTLREARAALWAALAAIEPVKP